VEASIAIGSERLILRPLRSSDEDDLLAYQSDPNVVRYIPWDVRTRDDVREALARAIAAPIRLLETGDHANLAIVLRETGRVIGQSNLSIASKADLHGELGYVINPSYARRGFATEATRAVLDFAFFKLNLHRVTARIDTRNVSSAAVAAKLGMRREAEFVEDEFFKGEWSSTWIYAILRAEWVALRDRHGPP
jgi:RimJ/RimL family protein N-acetyltransferase